MVPSTTFSRANVFPAVEPLTVVFYDPPPPPPPPHALTTSASAVAMTAAIATDFPRINLTL